jgi:hypothetical protein
MGKLHLHHTCQCRECAVGKAKRRWGYATHRTFLGFKYCTFCRMWGHKLRASDPRWSLGF